MPPTFKYSLEGFALRRNRALIEEEVGVEWTEGDEIEANNVYVDENVRNFIASKPSLTEEEKIIIQRLAMKSFHFPNYSFWGDWYMFFSNNHITLSFCLAHPLHPFGTQERILNLLASLMFGLAATSFIAMYYFHHLREENITYINLFGVVKVTQGLVVHAFFGGFCNVLFDFFIWYLQVCPPCQPGSPCADRISRPLKLFFFCLGSNMAFIVTLIALCLAVHFVTLRASYIEDGDEDDYASSIQSYSFLTTFLMEVLITQTVMFPIVAFTIFSGVLGCFTLPGIGGRPYQVKRDLQRKQNEKYSGPVEV